MTTAKALRLFGILILAQAMGCAGGEREAAGSIDVGNGMVLSSVDSVDLLSHPPSIASSGIIAALQDAPPSGAIAMFDAEGRYRYSFGRSGRGPGEISRILSFGFGPADSLWIIDGLYQAKVFTPPPEHRYVRTVQFDAPVAQSLVTARGVLTAPLMFNTTWRPPTLLDWNGKTRVRFGASRTAPDAEQFMGPVAVVDSTRVWAARSHEYAIELVDSSGRIVRRIGRTVDWFPPNSGPAGPPWSSRPQPAVTDITTDAEGRIWLLFRRAHRNWTPRTIQGQRRNGPISVRSLPGASEVAEMFEGVIEVLDANTGALIASREVSGNVMGFVDGAAGVRYIRELRELPDGRSELRLARIRLRQYA